MAGYLQLLTDLKPDWIQEEEEDEEDEEQPSSSSSSVLGSRVSTLQEEETELGKESDDEDVNALFQLCSQPSSTPSSLSAIQQALLSLRAKIGIDFQTQLATSVSGESPLHFTVDRGLSQKDVCLIPLSL